MARFKYIKITLLGISFLFAYIFFTGQEFAGFRVWMQGLGLFGAFLAGILYVYGFTAALGTATLLVIAKDQPFLLAGFIAGIGAVIGDLIIFDLLRHDFMDEIKMLGNEKWVIKLRTWLGNKIHIKIKKTMLPVIGAFIIASPLPDEIGVSLMAADKDISQTLFAVISYAINTLGIITILYVGNLL